MKKALIIIVILVAALGAFWLFQDDPEPVTVPTEPVTAPEEVAPESEPATDDPLAEPEDEPLPEEEDALLDTPETEPESAIDQALDEADEAAAAAESAIADILEQQEEAAAEAEAAAQAAIDEAMAAGDEAAAEAEAAVDQAQRSMAEQMEATEPEADPLAETGTADPDLQAAADEGVFEPETFDFDRAMEAIDDADLDPINTSAARALLESVRDDPDALEAALTQLRDMLGL